MRLNKYYIYKITNNLNNKIYVGQHKERPHETPREYMGKGIALRSAYKKYGIQNFTKEIIEYLYDDDKHEKVSEREKFWIKELNSLYPNGYNISQGGEGGCPKESAKKGALTRKQRGYRHSQQTKNKISKSHKGKTLTKQHKENLSKNHHLRKTWIIIKEDGSSFVFKGSIHQFIQDNNISSFNSFIRKSYYKMFSNGFRIKDIKKEDYAILRELKGGK